MNNLCFSATEDITAYASMAITAVNVIINVVPDPDKIQNPFWRMCSRILHFIAIDIVTAKK